MNDLKIYRSLIEVLNPRVLEVLLEHFDNRIEIHRLQLEKSDSIEEIKMAQGAIRELKHLKKLRDNAVDVLKER